MPHHECCTCVECELSRALADRDRRIEALIAQPKWLAFDVGCIECRESSGVIGLYDNEAAARAACDVAEAAQAKKWSGEHRMEVFHLDDDRSSWAA
jgi:hypothetical protein